jgi:NADH dehydrogenase
LAITATRSLRKAIAAGEVEVTVVSRENYHVFHGFVSEMMTGRIQPGQILSPVRRIFSPAKIHVGEIESIDLVQQKVVTSRHLDGKTFELEYDHVIFGLGSVDNLTSYPGLAEHAFKLKTYDDCFRLKNHILTMFELADIETDPLERKRLLTFFVAGGGYAGTEVAGELADFIHLLTNKEYPNIRKEECRVVLIHPGPHILPELYQGTGAAGYGEGYPRLVQFATKHLKKLGVEIMTDTRVSWATPNEVGLSNGVRVPARTIISAVGTKPAPILDTLALPRHTSGRIETNTDLRIPGYSNVWAGGDCAAVPHPLGGICPPVGIYALQEGTHISQNILRVMADQPAQPFTYRGLGQAVSIGRRTAVGEMRGIEFTGLLCWLIWRLMLIYYIPTWDRKLRLVADWLIWPLVGRDIVEMSVNDSDDYEINHHVFQPGEIILSQNSIGRYAYLITSGEVELYRTSFEGEEIAAALGEGSYFGHTQKNRRLSESVRAKTIVQAVSVRSDQAHRLHYMLASLNKLVSSERS